MRFLTYAGLEPGPLRVAFDKVRGAIERDDLRSADVKKLQSAPYYRAKLDKASRLLLTFVRYRDETACLALEIIAHHAYDRSRFLRGVRVDPARIGDATAATIATDATPVRYLHPGRAVFQLLDKPISFDDVQNAVYRQPVPLVLAIWRHGIKHFPIRYDPMYWGALFPVGMYAVATLRMLRALDLHFLRLLPYVFFIIALVFWLVLITGQLRALARNRSQFLTPGG